MIDRNIRKENEYLRFLVEELKRENTVLSRSVEMSMEQAEHFMAEHQAVVMHAQERIQELEHLVHCASCRARVGGELGMEFSSVHVKEKGWGTN